MLEHNLIPLICIVIELIPQFFHAKFPINFYLFSKGSISFHWVSICFRNIRWGRGMKGTCLSCFNIYGSLSWLLLNWKLLFFNELTNTVDWTSTKPENLAKRTSNMLPGKNNYFIHYVSGLPWIVDVCIYGSYSTLC